MHTEIATVTHGPLCLKRTVIPLYHTISAGIYSRPSLCLLLVRQKKGFYKRMAPRATLQFEPSDLNPQGVRLTQFHTTSSCFTPSRRSTSPSRRQLYHHDRLHLRQ